MATMTLKGLPTEEDLDQQDVSVEGFLEEWHQLQQGSGGLSVPVEDLGDRVRLGEYVLVKQPWFEVSA
ncbi:hypothetical protein [Ramlibacter sp. AN1133]|uniref:hypothetical protein n=1 Tax=Ramlibacter sp. AN1133 TaxID=3133429 RepID=UPI0030C339A2